ncbi:MAG TPA: zinc metalloprotease HtpX [Rhodocyclaceae bacterium]
MKSDLARSHLWTNRAQTLLLIGLLVALGGLAGFVLLGELGFWAATLAILLALVVEPVAASRLTLLLYGARPIPRGAAPQLWLMLDELARCAGLPATPLPYFVPTRVINAFAVGNRRVSAIALTDGLLREMGGRELAGVLAHEVAHVANGDLRVMNLADYVSRLTALLSLVGLALWIYYLPGFIAGTLDPPWIGLLLLSLSPHLALVAQLGLSRVREFAADLTAARLTGDPMGLAGALAKIERATRSWRSWVIPGWENANPSWLRSHPETTERIRRLMAISGFERRDDWGAFVRPECGPPVTRRPRLVLTGIWR